MAERIISPNVYMRENDQSFLVQGTGNTGCAFIGPFSKGPAFLPVVVTSQTDLEAKFGTPTIDFYTPASVELYLTDAASATVVRVLGLDGYDSTIYKSLVLTVSGTNGSVPVTVGLIHPTQVGVTLPTGSIAALSTPNQFTLTISGSDGLTTFASLSLNPSSTNYWANVLGSNPSSTKDGYAYVAFPDAVNFISGSLVGSGSIFLSLQSTELMLSGSTFGSYTPASTPWIRTQLIGGSYHNLFKVYTLSDGGAANTDIKVSIANIRPDPTGVNYGTFTLLVRDFGDTDDNPSVLEQFDNLTLDQTSTDYVAMRIGTAHAVQDSSGDVFLDGDFPNNSKYIYVDMDSGVSSLPNTILPYSFAAPNTPLNRVDVPAPDYIVTRYSVPQGSTTAVADNNVYYGLNFTSANTVAYCNALPSGSINHVGITDLGGVADTGFDLLTTPSATDLVDINATTGTSVRKFTVLFQGGFDGQNPAVVRATGANITSTNSQGYDLSDSTKSGAKAYVMAIDALSDPDNVDIDMLVMPGVIYSQHVYVAQTAISMVESRGDTFFILDNDILGGTVNSATNAIQTLDSSYAGTYYPWIKIVDISSGQLMWAPPSVVMPGVFAQSDKFGDEWSAPAGLNRGGISAAVQVRTRLSKDDKDELYDGRVNPIASFPAQGITVWGQKTLQHQASALDRINVRRLVINVKKFFRGISRFMLFEQNTTGTRNRLLSVVNPYLANVQQRQGLYAFKVVSDDTNNTPDIIDRNQMVVDVYLQPTKTAEFIILNFNILPTGTVISG